MIKSRSSQSILYYIFLPFSKARVLHNYRRPKWKEMNFLRKCRSHKVKIILAVLLLYGLFQRISISKISLEDSELEKCPACFGTNICPAFESGDIQFTGFTSWRILQFFNVKNVFYGFWGSRNISIVIKV